MSPTLQKVLEECEKDVNYIEGVDRITGHLAKEQPKLSCTDNEGLGLRSSHKAHEISREDFVRSVRGKPSAPVG